jgi:site-specific DNA-methyltransferase (adenine-specific)
MVISYLSSEDLSPMLLSGDAETALRDLPSESVDCCITSPPYWGKRSYSNGGIGLESSWQEYAASLLLIFAEVKRVLKPTGSFWLNIGDSYLKKSLIGIPWRVCLSMTDQQGWILRNSIIWSKIKGGMDNTTDRLANTHENLFHFVKSPRGYYYNADAIRRSPKTSRISNGSVVTASGVSGVRYQRQLELSTALTAQEKEAALKALNQMLLKVAASEIADFRMIIRGQQRTTHSDSAYVSGRAKELNEKGFYFLKYHPNGSKPGDVWEILPEDTQQRESHFAPFPEDLCRIPILATCPVGGLLLDPFCGTGTSLVVAYTLGRKSIGIDIAPLYLSIAQERIRGHG